ncbi:MAG: TolC family protein [Synergistaceae bacterium]|jgi:outer membrane protein TolC|nr:TolC family protein [Synergistaceae bacterium]
MGPCLKKFAFILTLSAAAMSFPGAARAGEDMGIREAIALTLERNAVLLSLRQELPKASAFKLQADGALTPEIGFSAGIDENRETQTSDGSDRYDRRNARLTLSQNIYSGGRNQALRRQSAQVRSIAERNLKDAENRAVGELFARFYNVLLQERRAETERSAISASEVHLREVTRMSELGLSNRLEVIRASQQLAANRANLSTAEGAHDSAVISLMNYMSIPPAKRRPVSGDLRALEIEGGRETSLDAARENRADLGALSDQIEYQKNQIEIERSALRPHINLGASAAVMNPYSGMDSTDDTWRAELTITVPILDRSSSKGNVLRARAIAEQNRISFEQRELDIESGVETAWTEMETASNHLEAASAALELAEETLRLAEVGFQEGVTPQLDLLSAQTSLTESRLEYLRSLYNRLLAVVAIKVTEGNIIEWAEEMEF